MPALATNDGVLSEVREFDQWSGAGIKENTMLTAQKKQKTISFYTFDITPRTIELTYNEYQTICEALVGITPKGKRKLTRMREERKEVETNIVKRWMSQEEFPLPWDEVVDARR